MTRLLFAGFGVGAFAFALLTPWFRNADGWLQATACLPMGLGVACVILATLPYRFGHARLWLALAALGQAAILQVTRAGPAVGYQHIMVPWEWTTAHVWALAIIAIQLVAVLIFGGDAPKATWRWLRGRFPGWRFWALVGLFGITAATLSADPRVYVVEIIWATILQLLVVWTLILAARSLPETAVETVRRRMDALLGEQVSPAVEGPLRLDRFAWLAALWTFALSAFLAVRVYGAWPHIGDEVAYLFHARYFAAGRLWVDIPQVPEAFRMGLVAFENGMWYSPVPPAWPAVFALGVWLGVPYLVNPALAAASVLLTYGVVGHLYPRRTARIATLLLATSPWFLFLAMSYMTHLLSLTAALCAAWCVTRLRLGGNLAWGVIGGLAIGLVGLTRPLEGLIVAGVLGLWTLSAASGWGRRVLNVSTLAVSSVAVAGATFPYNRIFTGSGLEFPIQRYTDRFYGEGTNALGFGPDRGFDTWRGLDPLPGHGFLDVLINGNLNLHGVNIELLGWGTGSLLIVLIGVLAMRRTRVDFWMAMVAATVVGAHSFYWFSGGPDFGARYWFLILVPTIALGARGVEALGDQLRTHGGPARVGFVAAGLLFITVSVFLPWRSIDKYRDYRGMRPDARQLAEEVDFGRGLVFIRGREFPDYVNAGLLNPLDFDEPQALFAHDKSPEIRRQVIAAYPDRPVWIVDGPERTGGGYTVIAGPLPAGQVPDVGP